MQAAKVDLLPTGQTVGYQSVTEPFAVTSPGEVCGISQVLMCISIFCRAMFSVVLQATDEGKTRAMSEP